MPRPTAYRLPPVVVSADAAGNGSTPRGVVRPASGRRTFLQVDAGYTNNDTQLLDRCAVSCFAAVAGHSTVPYFSADAPRSVSLVYHGDRLAVRPFVHADVSLGTGAPAATELWLEATVNGSAATFVNGDQRLRFSGSSASTAVVRLAGQLDASALATGVYPMTLTVGAVYANSTTEQQSVTTKLLIVNERASPIARGWTVAGVPRLYIQSDGSALHTDGTGSAIHFATCGTDCFSTPAGDFSALSGTGTGSSRSYTRAFVDSTKVLFDHTGRATSVTDRFGNAVTFGYDGNGRLTSITDPVRKTPGNQPSAIVLTYGTYGLTQIQEPGADGTSGAGRSTLYTVASDSTLRVAKDSDGDSTRFAYDGSRRLSTVTDRRGQTSTFGYAASWKLATVQAPAITVGSSTTTNPTTTLSAWQAVGVPTASTASTLATPALRDTVRGSVTNPRGATVQFTVDRWGQPLAVTDPLGQVTTTVRSGLFPVTVTYPTGGVDSLTFTGQFLTAMRPSGGAHQTFTYGAYGQLLQTYINGLLTAQNYLNSAGTQVSSTQVPTVGGTSSVSWGLGYDTRGQVTSVTDAVFGTTQYTRDNRTGNVSQVNTPDSRWVYRTPDAVGRDSVLRAVDGTQLRMIYDPENRLTSRADSSSGGWRTTTNIYNPLDLVRFKDAGNNVHRFGVNPVGWRTQLFDPADTLSRYQALEYDAGGLVTAVTNRRGQQRTFAYDVLGRLVARTAPAGSGTAVDSFAVSTNGRITAHWNAIARDSSFFAASGWRDSAVTYLNGTRYLRTFTPDTNGRLRQMTLWATAGGTTQQLATRNYFLDAATGLPTQVYFARPNDPNGQLGNVTYQYNGQNRRALTGHFGFNGTLVSNRTDSYTNDGRIYETSIGTMKRRFGYDSAGRVRFAGQVFPNGSESNWRYLYNTDGQLAASDSALGYTSNGSQFTFGYRATSTSPRASYAYDAAGNRTTPGGLTYGAGNRVSSGVTFDLDGNVTNDGSVQYFWSAANALDSLKFGGNKILRYSYDATGRLSRRVLDSTRFDFDAEAWVSVPGTPTWYLWDRDDLLAEVSNTGVVQAEFIHAGGIDHPLAWIDWSGSIRFLHQDVLGSVFASTGSAQPVAFRYDAWGAPLGTSKPGAMRHGWKGMLWEPEAGLYYARNRWYHVASGRFLTEDPLGLAGGANLYVFAGNDPVNYRDPYGLDCSADEATALMYVRNEDGDWVEYRTCPRSMGMGGTTTIGRGSPLLGTGGASTGGGSTGGLFGGGGIMLGSGSATSGGTPGSATSHGTTLRLWGPDGNALTDYDWHRPHGNQTTPHAHDWTAKGRPKGPAGARPVRPGELSSEWSPRQGALNSLFELLSTLMRSRMVPSVPLFMVNPCVMNIPQLCPAGPG